MTNDQLRELAMREWFRQAKTRSPLGKLRRNMLAADRELKKEFKKHQRRIQAEYAAKRKRINQQQRELAVEAEKRRWAWLEGKAQNPQGGTNGFGGGTA